MKTTSKQITRITIQTKSQGPIIFVVTQREEGFFCLVLPYDSPADQGGFMAARTIAEANAEALESIKMLDCELADELPLIEHLEAAVPATCK